MTNHQRIGATSNAHAGREFEEIALAYFSEREGIELTRSFRVPIGIGATMKSHMFDLGSKDPSVLVECKSHNWTTTGNMPSAKMTVWNEAMFYFFLAPSHYRKVLFVIEARHDLRRETLADYYVRTNPHLIPPDVSIVEYNPTSNAVRYVVGVSRGAGNAPSIGGGGRS